MEKPKRLEVFELFKQREYQKVIDRLDLYFRSSSENTISSKGSLLELKLMYLFSSLCLGQELNKEYELEVLYGYYDNNPEAEALYKALMVKSLMLQLDSQIDQVMEYLRQKKDIEALRKLYYKEWVDYKKLKTLLSDLSSIDHGLYDLLNKELEVTNKLLEEKLKKYIQERMVNISNSEELVCLVNLYARLGEYDLALEKLDNFHEDIGETPDTLMLAGICYQSLGEYEKALSYFERFLPNEKVRPFYFEKYLPKSEDLSRELAFSGRYLQCLSQCLKSEDTSNLRDKKEWFNIYNNLLIKQKEYKRPSNKSNPLYKYYPLNEYTLDALSNQYFYLAPKNQLNDPTELPYEHIKEIEKYKVIRSDFKISSFSKNQNSMLMWSHYTDNHQGIMVGYCIDKVFGSVGIRDVLYSSVLERSENKETYIFDQYLLTKNKDWAYEKEVRLFGYEKNKIHYSAKPEPDKIQAYIQSITLGYKFPKSMRKLIKLIVDDIEKNNNYKIKIQQARLSRDNPFVIEYKDLDLDNTD